MSDRNYCLFCGTELPEIRTVQGFSGERGTAECTAEGGCGTVYDLTVHVRESPDQ